MTREAILIAVALLAATLTITPATAETCGPLHAAPAGTSIVADPGVGSDTLVLVMKGVDHVAADHAALLDKIAAHGAIGVAIDYPDFAARYAADLAGNVVWDILDANPSVERVVVFGISGGFPAVTLLLTEGWTKPDCSPLVDVLFDVEGVSSLVDTYAEARAAYAAVPAAGEAVLEIEAECGAPAALDCLAARSLVANGADADLQLDGAAVFHGINDGLVPFNQGVEAAAVLEARTPTSFTILLRNDPAQRDDKDTQATEYVSGPAGLPDAPLSGHASEDDADHVLVRVAQAELLALLDGTDAPAAGVHVVDGAIGALA